MNHRNTSCWTAAIGCALLFVVSELPAQQHTSYELLKVLDVAGRQGVATDGKHYFVSGSTQLYTYSKDGTLLDNVWRLGADAKATAAYVTHELALSGLRDPGEVEGIAFDADAGEMLVLANRGKRIVLGMPKGLYPGYDRELHEIYVFKINATAQVPD